MANNVGHIHRTALHHIGKSVPSSGVSPVSDWQETGGGSLGGAVHGEWRMTAEIETCRTCQLPICTAVISTAFPAFPVSSSSVGVTSGREGVEGGCYLRLDRFVSSTSSTLGRFHRILVLSSSVVEELWGRVPSFYATRCVLLKQADS